MELPKTMELPKNIVQIGKPDPTHKIFVEDYVISYMKQWNKHGKRDTGIVLFGKKMAEGECRYYFVYGASYMPGVEARAQYLTEEEREEVEEIRARHFAEYELLGWGELRGELPEGFYMCEHNKGVWVRGYACFFEKNDSMLSFMVTEGSKELENQTAVLHKVPEQTNFIRESNIDARMEERNRKLEQIRQNQVPVTDKVIREMPLKEGERKSWKNGAMAMALLVCVVAGLVLTDTDKRKSLEAMVENVVAIATKEATKLQDSQVENLQAQSLQAQNPVASQSEEQLPEAVESQAGVEPQGELASQGEAQPQGEGISQTGTAMQGEVVTQGETPQPQGEVAPQGEMASQGESPVQQQSQETSDVVAETNGGAQAQQDDQEVVARYVSYTIQKGDTLLDICRRECGSEAMLQQICQLNSIDDPDDIKIGQIILLPE